TRSTAIAAAFSPAACPPMPSTTRKMPRSPSIWKASSLLRRTRPGSLPPANLSLVLTIRGASELQENHAGKADSRPRRQRRFLIGRRCGAVDGGAERAYVGEVKL